MCLLNVTRRSEVYCDIYGSWSLVQGWLTDHLSALATNIHTWHSLHTYPNSRVSKSRKHGKDASGIFWIAGEEKLSSQPTLVALLIGVGIDLSNLK